MYWCPYQIPRTLWLTISGDCLGMRDRGYTEDSQSSGLLHYGLGDLIWPLEVDWPGGCLGLVYCNVTGLDLERKKYNISQQLLPKLTKFGGWKLWMRGELSAAGKREEHLSNYSEEDGVMGNMYTRNIRGRVWHNDGASESGLEFITVMDRDIMGLWWLIHDARFILLVILSILRRGLALLSLLWVSTLEASSQHSPHWTPQRPEPPMSSR